MKTTQKIAAAVLVLLLGGTIYGLLRTEPRAVTPTKNGKGSNAAVTQAPLVDKSPLETAQRLAQMPTSPEELPFAQEALRIGDQEMDLAFAAALRDATHYLNNERADAIKIAATRNKMTPEMAEYIVGLYTFKVDLAESMVAGARTEEAWMRGKERLKGSPIDWSKVVERGYFDRAMSMQ